MTEETRKRWEGKAIVIAAVVAAITVFYFWISAQYPYYFMWDQDYVLTLDSVLIQSGLLPDHIHHPGFGLNFLWVFTQKIAHSLNKLSILTLEDLQGSLNPFAAMAEQVAFMRLHTPIVLTVMVLSLWMALTRLFSPPFWLSIGILLYLGTQNSVIYHASMIRTEAYSLFYWSLALAFSVCALKRGKNKWLWYLMTGAMLGLAFLTKLQCFFYLLGYVLFFILAGMITHFQRLPLKSGFTSTDRWTDLFMAFIGLGFYVGLLAIGASVPIPPGLATWTKNYYISPIAILFLLVFLALLLLSFRERKKVSPTIQYFGGFRCREFIFIAWGFLGSFLLHFFLFSDFTIGFQYLIYDFKMLFLRMSFHQSHSLHEYMNHLIQIVSFEPLHFILHLLLFLFVALFRKKMFESQAISRIFLVLIGLFWALLYVNILLGTRDFLRDLLWVEVLLVFSICLFLLMITQARVTKRRYRIALCLVVLALGIGSNVSGAITMFARTDADYNHYGWESNYFFSGVFSRNHRTYTEIMKKRYSRLPGISLVKRQAERASETRRTVSFVFKNQSLSFQHIGIVAPGFWVWRDDPSYRFSKIPHPLIGSILVDNMNVPIKNKIYFRDAYVVKDERALDKIQKPPQDDSISILPRKDLDVFLFTPSTVSSQKNNDLPEIIIEKGTVKRSYFGRKIQETKLQIDRLPERYFFLIKENF
jgi:hypothetical protein